jgi:uncharacterized protein (TIGR03790 family)
MMAACAASFNVSAGGSGLNTILVVNQASSNSVELGNYYCERRQVPPENVLRIRWTGGNVSWNQSQFETNLLNPLVEMVAARKLDAQVHYVVLSMDIPFQTTYLQTINSTTAALFYGLKNAAGAEWASITNSYARSEQSFPAAKPQSAKGPSFLTTMITAKTLDQARAIVDQGVASDGLAPNEPVIFAKTSDTLRNIRHRAFDNAILDLRLMGRPCTVRTNSNQTFGLTNLFGLQTGLANFSVSPRMFVPGAIADSLTSHGGVIFGPNSQTTLLAFLQAGAAGSYGTVAEPTPNPDKFPDPVVYFYQARGFSLAEAYYQSVFIPHEGLIVGEPLAAPYARPGSIRWLNLSANMELSGVVPLALRAVAHSPQHPLQRVELFLDGKFHETLTNLAPSPGNLLHLSLNGYPITSEVNEQSTLADAVMTLAAAVNRPDVQAITGVLAIPHGDRLELQSSRLPGMPHPAFHRLPTPLGVGTYCRVVYLDEDSPPRLTVLGRGEDGNLRLAGALAAAASCVVEASSDLALWTPIFTNTSASALEFVDIQATNYPRRFYRLAVPSSRPALTGAKEPAGYRVRVRAPPGVPCRVESSTDLVHWAPLTSNAEGGNFDFLDPELPGGRFYRAVIEKPAPVTPGLKILETEPSSHLLEVTGATRPYLLEYSTDLVHWQAAATNFAPSRMHAQTGSSSGSAPRLSTFLTASSAEFLDSPAFGFRSCQVSGTLQPGTWLRLTALKTNGTSVSVAFTNQNEFATIMNLVEQLVAKVNAEPALQGPDGLVVEDLTAGWFSSALFSLRARGPGLGAAALRVSLAGSDSLVIRPETETTLDENIADLRPRNHVFVTAGAPQVTVNLTLDTSLLADGFHELTAVAYEGSSVSTQTRTSLPVQVRNTALAATIERLPDEASLPATATFQVRVACNTADVNRIDLFSTGGRLAMLSAQSTALFSVNGSTLGAGLHPFYAVVETRNGASYRTETLWVRFTR